jgi:hypothetical protein
MKGLNKINALVLSAAIAAAGAVPGAAWADSDLEAYGQKGYVGPVTYAAPKSYHGKHHGHVHARKKVVRVVAVPPCPVNYTGMYRGTLYCLHGKIVH